MAKKVRPPKFPPKHLKCCWMLIRFHDNTATAIGVSCRRSVLQCGNVARIRKPSRATTNSYSQNNKIPLLPASTFHTLWALFFFLLPMDPHSCNFTTERCNIITFQWRWNKRCLLGVEKLESKDGAGGR